MLRDVHIICLLCTGIFEKHATDRRFRNNVCARRAFPIASVKTDTVHFFMVHIRERWIGSQTAGVFIIPEIRAKKKKVGQDARRADNAGGPYVEL